MSEEEWNDETNQSYITELDQQDPVLSNGLRGNDR